MIEIPVELGARTYPIVIGHGMASSLHELIGQFRGRRFAVVSNLRVSSLHGAKVEQALKKLGTITRILIPDGERHKTLDTMALIHNGLLAAGLGRDAVVVAFGGGVVGDVAGFAAATYMRGVDWVQVPTTLLAMVDSSIGGKVGVNHAKAKNLIGAFHQPRAVVADPSFLDTLPPRELRSGAYEILKCGVIADRALVGAIQAAPPGLRGWGRADLENAIASACRIKAEVVERDEREGDRRRVLNLGHTLGHALEAGTGYRRFTHGEAVGWGLVGAAWIAARKGLLREAAFDAIAAAVDHLGPRPKISDLPAEKILTALAGDKKVREGRPVFVLPTAIGRVEIRADVKTSEIRHALKVMASREARMG
ncbi:MAG TPA: 3-dehydroquinate synthase [Vicinamibacteria bacterium]|nr:3-dehydroquinate synthase [Vicinamibacteria bacterium]